MNKNTLLLYKNTIFRVLDIMNSDITIVNCFKYSMPKIVPNEIIKEYEIYNKDIFDAINIYKPKTMPLTEKIDFDELSNSDKKKAYDRYSMIVPILPHISDTKKRSAMISLMADVNNISVQSIKKYLWKYLVYQDLVILAPKQTINDIALNIDEKNIRWALNKYFYTIKKNSLNTAYIYMLKEKYCDENGNLYKNHPSFYQFRYFYRKHKKLQNYYIARNGLKDYQKNKRPLLGDNVQEYAKNIGMGMLDATICDIYLVDDNGNIVGRPILTACIDAYSSLCMGYSLTWEGGMYSLKYLMQNIIMDKQKLCNDFGINITKEDWNVNKLPGIFVTDKGSEYISENFEQISELGIKIINLPAYRPELKGPVEKFFDLIQNSFKPYLKGKGVIEPDFMERGSHDYRKDACLTMSEFEKIIIKCIIFYNTKRTIDNFPYTEDMLNKIKPFANEIWNYSLNTLGVNLIDVDKDILRLTLLPRTIGKFSRFGLIVNKLRYRSDDNFTEKYLNKEKVTVAYNPYDTSIVWYLDNGDFLPFNLIEKQYEGKNLEEIQYLNDTKKNLLKEVSDENLQGKIDLAKSIEMIADKNMQTDVNLKNIRKNRKIQKDITHDINI